MLIPDKSGKNIYELPKSDSILKKLLAAQKSQIAPIIQFKKPEDVDFNIFPSGKNIIFPESVISKAQKQPKAKWLLQESNIIQVIPPNAPPNRPMFGAPFFPNLLTNVRNFFNIPDEPFLYYQAEEDDSVQAQEQEQGIEFFEFINGQGDNENEIQRETNEQLRQRLLQQTQREQQRQPQPQPPQPQPPQPQPQPNENQQQQGWLEWIFGMGPVVPAPGPAPNPNPVPAPGPAPNPNLVPGPAPNPNLNQTQQQIQIPPLPRQTQTQQQQQQQQQHQQQQFWNQLPTQLAQDIKAMDAQSNAQYEEWMRQFTKFARNKHIYVTKEAMQEFSNMIKEFQQIARANPNNPIILLFRNSAIAFQRVAEEVQRGNLEHVYDLYHYQMVLNRVKQDLNMNSQFTEKLYAVSTRNPNVLARDTSVITRGKNINRKRVNTVRNSPPPPQYRDFKPETQNLIGRTQTETQQEKKEEELDSSDDSDDDDNQMLVGRISKADTPVWLIVLNDLLPMDEIRAKTSKEQYDDIMVTINFMKQFNQQPNEQEVRQLRRLGVDLKTKLQKANINYDDLWKYIQSKFNKRNKRKKKRKFVSN